MTTAKSTAWRRTQSRNLRRAPVERRFLALARRAVLYPGRQVAAGDVYGDRCPFAPAADGFLHLTSRAQNISDSASVPMSRRLWPNGDGPGTEKMIGQAGRSCCQSSPCAEEMDAYERVLGDAMAGDATLFAREDMWKRRGESSIRCCRQTLRSTNTNQAPGDRAKSSKSHRREAGTTRR